MPKPKQTAGRNGARAGARAGAGAGPESGAGSYAAYPDQTAVQVYLFRDGQAHELPADLDALEQHLGAQDSFVWINLVNPMPGPLLTLQETFGLHPLAIEDALHAHQRAKVEIYRDFWFVVAHHATISERNVLIPQETALFIGSSFVVTCQYQRGQNQQSQNQPGDAEQPFTIQDILTRWEQVPGSWRHNSSSLVYVFFDALVDSFGPLTDDIDQEIKTVRTWLASGKAVRPAVLRRIFALEDLAHEAYAIAMTLRDVLPPFIHAAEESPIGNSAAPYYRDVHDHAIGIVDRLHTEQEASKRAFDIYQSLASQQQNAVARQLTVVATVFLPLTFLTGFFGQNFDFLVKAIASKHAFLLWGVGSYAVSLVAILLLIWMVARE